MMCRKAFFIFHRLVIATFSGRNNKTKRIIRDEMEKVRGKM